MQDVPRSSFLLGRVAHRLRMVSIGRRFYVLFIISCLLYAVVFLSSRLLGLIPDLFGPTTLVGIPAVAVLLSLFLHRRRTNAEAAWSVDARLGTKDLYLTLSLLENSAGQYKPLVIHDAEARAPSIKPVEVVPYRWQKRLSHVVAMLLVLLAGVLFLPQLDPFGKVEAAQQGQKRREQLAESHKATRLRIAMLKRDDQNGRKSPKIEKAIENLKTALKKMKPVQKKKNFKKLAESQKTLGEEWRKLRAEKLKELLNQKSTAQKFGGANKETLRKWKRQLQQGHTESLKKEIDEMKEVLKRLQKTKDPVEKKQLAQNLRKKLRDIEELASEHVKSKPLSAALKRAMNQLEMSNSEGLSAEALESLAQSLDLTQLELEEIALSAKDLKNLEQALKLTQLAKKLNEKGELSGEASGQFNSLDDYEKLYNEMLAQGDGQGNGQGNGNGPGLGGKGIGEGGKAPEDDSVKTDFTSERSRSAVTAGKIILTLKSKGLSDRGDARKNYSEAIRNVKQGVSEAILQEQIPPGYHESIKQYFDTIKSDLDEPEEAEK